LIKEITTEVRLLSACTGEQATEAPGTQPAAVSDVRVAVAAMAPVQNTVDVTGTVRTKTQMLIASKVPGYVREVRVREGDRVEAGAVLVTVDAREFVARVDHARAALAEAEMGLDEATKTLEESAAALRSAEADQVYADATATRYRRLLAEGLVSAQDYEAVEAKRKSGAAAVDQAGADPLARARETLMATVSTRPGPSRGRPSSRWTTRLTARPMRWCSGAWNRATWRSRADPPCSTTPASTGWAKRASPPGHVRLRQPVPVVIDALGRTLEGRVAEIVAAADPGSRTVTVKLDLPPDPALRSGLFGRARFPTGAREALLVPTAALVERGQLTGLYVVDDRGVARLRLVTVGTRQADRVEILRPQCRQASSRPSDD
jgi:multidrug efflux pump subunit AcrA (membrane-fusion protein)